MVNQLNFLLIYFKKWDHTVYYSLKKLDIVMVVNMCASKYIIENSNNRRSKELKR